MNVFELAAKLTLDTSEYEKSLDGASGGLGKMSSVAGAVGKTIATGIATATAAVTAFAGKSVVAGMDFDSSMAQVAATMGTTVENIQNLRDYAQEMGSTTAFSATQAADALNYMALAGYDADTSMKMLPNVLNLAAAGGIELAQASDMVTDAQSALGLSLDDTSKMVDQMAAASSKSNTSVAQLGEAFLTIGANAKDLKGGTTELATALGLLADNGIKGAEGGTHLRNIMLSLNPTTDDAIEAWTQLGISAYDAQGNLRPLEDTFGDLNKAMAGMNSQEKSDILTKMFNKTDLASVNALLATSSERWQELGSAIDDSAGAAEKMANTQLDNLAGDITLFQSALEGAQIALSDQLTPTLREFVQFGSDGLSRLTEAFKEGGLSGAMDEFGAILSDGLNMVVEMLPQAISAGAEMFGAFLDGVVQNIPQIAEAASEIIITLAQGIIENAPKIIEGALQLILGLANGISQSLPELIPAVVEVVLQITESLIDNVDLLIDGAIALILGLTEGLINAMPRLIEKIPELVMKIVKAIITNAPKMLEAALQLVVSLLDGLVKSWAKIITELPKLLKQIFEAIKKFDLSDAGKNLVEGLWKGIKEKWSKLVDDVKKLGKDLITSVKDIFGIHSPSKVFAEIGDNLGKGLNEGWDDSFSVFDKQITSDLDKNYAMNATFEGNSSVNGSNAGMLNQILAKMDNLSIYLDGSVLVGGIVDSMDSALGNKQLAYARGM